jgi:hypothetical protein
MTKLKAWKCFSVVIAVVLILGVAAIAFPTTPVGAQAGTWDIQTVDDVSVISTSLALDSQGYPHIAYTTTEFDGTPDHSLHYASWTGTNWVTELVDDVAAGITSLALDSNDRPHICYTTAEFASLHYAHWTGTGWGLDSPYWTVDASTVTDCSLALDSQGRPHVCYITPGVVGHELQYAWLTNTGWDHSLSTFDPDSGYPNSCSLALDSQDNPHVGFATSGGPFTVHYYYRVGSAWGDEVVDDVPGGSVSIALDSQGNPHISYATAEVGTGSLHYASRMGGVWGTETVDPADVSDCSLALDSQNRPHISYHVGIGGFSDSADIIVDHTTTTTGILKYAYWTGTAWDIQTVDQETATITGTSIPIPVADSTFFILGPGKWCSLALDSDDLPHISYGNLISFSLLSLRYAHIVLPPAPQAPTGPGSYSPPIQLPRLLNPANMSVMYLSINPQQATANQPVTISTNVVNTGDEGGNYSIALKVNGEVVETRMVSVGPQATQPIKFTVTRTQPGTYTVAILDKSGSFTVLGASTSAGSKTVGIIILALVGILIVASVVVLLIRRA